MDGGGGYAAGRLEEVVVVGKVVEVVVKLLVGWWRWWWRWW